MTLDQILKIYKNGGYLGGTFFPIERLTEYAELVTNVLKNYPTATALAPLLVTLTPFEWGNHPTYTPLTNGFQLATFLLDAQISARFGNDFAEMVFE